MEFFTPRKIIDPQTGKERIVSIEEQKLLLEKGVIFDVPLESDFQEDQNKKV